MSVSMNALKHNALKGQPLSFSQTQADYTETRYCLGRCTGRRKNRAAVQFISVFGEAARCIHCDSPTSMWPTQDAQDANPDKIKTKNGKKKAPTTSSKKRRMAC